MRLGYRPAIELPVLPEDTEIALSKEDMVTLAQRGTSFVRSVRMHDRMTHGCDSLQELIDKTDEQLEHIAQIADASVVDHEWGLFQLPEQPDLYESVREQQHRRASVVPAGHLLVATVTSIEAETAKAFYDDPAAKLKLCQAINVYNRESRGPRSHMLTDMSYWQFRYGINPQDPHKTRRLWLLDIEPLLKRM